MEKVEHISPREDGEQLKQELQDLSEECSDVSSQQETLDTDPPFDFSLLTTLLRPETEKIFKHILSQYKTFKRYTLPAYISKTFRNE